MQEADIGLIGLAVMGQNLVLNMNDHGFQVVVYNRTSTKVDEFLSGPAKGTKIMGAHSLEEFFKKLKRPRKVMMMVKAGQAIDDLMQQCLPYMEKGDIFIDGGNSHYPDTNRRCDEMLQHGIHFVGAGVSGGEEGARHGPSIMPGGHIEAWPNIKGIFQAICAKAENGEPCCEWVGDKGSGHYVKMVHNGIEYGDMQLICEAYNLMHDGLGCKVSELHQIFKNWNKEELNSYLIEITAHIFSCQDTDGSPLVEKILDVAGQKGTGKWTGMDAMELGVPLTLIGEAVFARCLSALKDERLKAAKQLAGPSEKFQGNRQEYSGKIKSALYASKIISYAQGFMLMREAAKEHGWELNYGAIALLWRGGCIIRSRFLNNIKEAFDRNPDLQNLMLDKFFKDELSKAQEGWRDVVALGVKIGIPLPCFSTAIAFYDGYRTARLPANLLQAQRDYFGAHTYERVDHPRGEFFHTNWSPKGGVVTSCRS